MASAARASNIGIFRLRPRSLAVIAAAAAPAAAAMAQQPPTLPSIGSAYDNVTVSNSNVDGGAVAVGNGSASSGTLNAAVINDAIAYVSSQGGGTVEIPASASAYIAQQIYLQDNVDLEIDSGATLQDAVPTATFITTNGSAMHDIEINGGGIINGNASDTSENNLVPLQNITNLEVTNVQINNSSHEHLVTEDDTNVTINDVTIADAKEITNSDGIDFSGSNFLIEDCNCHDGDDDIVAKPQTVPCSNILIENCTATMGHGISIGGETGAGLNGMTVENCYLNNTLYGLRLKAGEGSGGLVQNVTFINISLNKVEDPIIIDSYYTNGDSDFPSSPPFAAATLNSLTPIWDNIAFENITIAGADIPSEIYGLNTPTPNIDGLLLKNITFGSDSSFLVYYAAGLTMQNVSGTLTKKEPQFGEYGDVYITPLQWAATGSATVAADTSGTWDTSTDNWVAPFATPVLWTENSAAQFGAGSGTNASPVTVSLAGPHTVYTLTFAANSPAYTLSGSSISILGDGAGDGIIDNMLSATISSNIVLPANGTSIGISVASGGVLNLTGTWTNNNASATLTKSGAGVVNMHNLSITGLDITGGTLALTAGGGTAGTSVISGGTLAISGGGALDINDHGMVIEYGSNPSPAGDLSFVANSGPRTYPANSIQAYAQTGIDDLNWDGPGINSSVAKNDASGLTAVGIVDENDLGIYPNDYTVAGGGTGTWMGQKITDANNVLVRMTYYGDGNLDGVVNKLDVTALSQGYSGLAGYVGWSDGDYNYDGQINKNDVSLLAQSYVFQGAPLGDAITPGQAQYMLALDPDMPANVQAEFDAIAAGLTPEPASLAVLCAAGVGLLGRRRRNIHA
jgi:glycosyl hydrolase family 28/dockerin type I repeat protein